MRIKHCALLLAQPAAHHQLVTHAHFLPAAPGLCKLWPQLAAIPAYKGANLC